MYAGEHPNGTDAQPIQVNEVLGRIVRNVNQIGPFALLPLSNEIETVWGRLSMSQAMPVSDKHFSECSFDSKGSHFFLLHDFVSVRHDVKRIWR